MTELIQQNMFLKKEQRRQPVLTDSTGVSVPKRLKSGFEHMSGLSFEDVRIHYSSPNPARIGAYAYAAGRNVYLGPGQEKYLPHELAHVMQQKQGRVLPTVSRYGLGTARNKGKYFWSSTCPDVSKTRRCTSFP